jgi:hypothetical protein
MHILILLLALLALVMAIVLITAACQPDIFRIERSATVKAGPEKLFSQIDDLRNWAAWSPFERLDPAMSKTFTGPASGKGAVLEWSGNSKAGAGRMEIIESTPPGRVLIKLDFLKPFEGHNTAEFTMVPSGEGTRITWSMTGKSPFAMKVMHLVLNMDKMLGKNFEEGLGNLKALAEK